MVSAPRHPEHQSSLDAAIPDEPPPVYSTVAASGDTSIDAGPSRVNFSGPPPRRDPPHLSSAPRPAQPPPQHPARHEYAPQTMDAGYLGNGGGRPGGDAVANVSPTDTPMPGRPLLHNGQILVYPRDYRCSKCGNTGYIHNDPDNPCADWRKYGKPYTSAVAHSYAVSTGSPGSNPTASASENFQHPLPSFSPPQAQPQTGSWHTYPGQSQQGKYAHLPPPPIAPARPPPPHQHQHQQIFVSSGQGLPPPGALVVAPGDPRIGGRPCWRCGGSGTEAGFWGFNDGRCGECRGLGRMFP